MIQVAQVAQALLPVLFSVTSVLFLWVRRLPRPGRGANSVLLLNPAPSIPQPFSIFYLLISIFRI